MGRGRRGEDRGSGAKQHRPKAMLRSERGGNGEGGGVFPSGENMVPKRWEMGRTGEGRGLVAGEGVRLSLCPPPRPPKDSSMGFAKESGAGLTGQRVRPKSKLPGKGQRVRWGSGSVRRSNGVLGGIGSFEEVVRESRTHSAGTGRSSPGGWVAEVEGSVPPRRLAWWT